MFCAFQERELCGRYGPGEAWRQQLWVSRKRRFPGPVQLWSLPCVHHGWADCCCHLLPKWSVTRCCDFVGGSGCWALLHECVWRSRIIWFLFSPYLGMEDCILCTHKLIFCNRYGMAVPRGLFSWSKAGLFWVLVRANAPEPRSAMQVGSKLWQLSFIPPFPSAI